MASPRLLVPLLVTLAAACADDGGADVAPAAPTNLEVTEASGGGHLTWSDNSDNEDHFMVLRKLEGEATFGVIATATFDAEQHHDAAVTSGTSYVYKIVAMNGAGESESDEVTFTVP